MAQASAAAPRPDPVRRTPRVEHALATMIEEVRAGLVAPSASRAAVQVLLRRARQRPLRGDHGAARVLPDAHRDGSARRARRRDRRCGRAPRARRARLGGRAQDPALPRRDARPRAAGARHPARDQRAATCASPSARLQADYPEARRLGCRGRLRPRPRSARAGRRTAAAVPRGDDRQPAPRRPAGVLPRTPRRSSRPATASSWASTSSRTRRGSTRPTTTRRASRPSSTSTSCAS